MTTALEKGNVLEQIQASFKQQGFESDATRKEAFEAFLATGLPKSKSEEYRFTPITRLLENEVKWHALPLTSTPQHLSPSSLQHPNQITFVNGMYAPALSKLKDQDIKLTDVAEDFDSGTDSFALLNAALHPRLLTIEIPDHSIPEHPIHITHYTETPSFYSVHTRWQCRVGKASSVRIQEDTQSPSGEYFSNRAASIHLGEDSSLEYVTIQNQRQEVMVSNLQIHLASRSKARCYTLTFDGKLVRNNLSMILDGEGIEAHLFGLSLLGGATLADNHTVVDHRQPNSVSNELYKGIMGEQSKGVFNGKIFVRPHAQKTNAYQTNRNIILGDAATVNTKPQLEIWADDVKCSHGCTTGQLDEEALFYLRSRGISEKSAKGMMLMAFATETIGEITDNPLHQTITGLISQKIAQLS